MYYIFKTCCIISVLFSTKCLVFCNLSFCIQITLKKFVMNHALKLNTHPVGWKSAIDFHKNRIL